MSPKNKKKGKKRKPFAAIQSEAAEAAPARLIGVASANPFVDRRKQKSISKTPPPTIEELEDITSIEDFCDYLQRIAKFLEDNNHQIALSAQNIVKINDKIKIFDVNYLRVGQVVRLLTNLDKIGFSAETLREKTFANSMIKRFLKHRFHSNDSIRQIIHFLLHMKNLQELDEICKVPQGKKNIEELLEIIYKGIDLQSLRPETTNALAEVILYCRDVLKIKANHGFEDILSQFVYDGKESITSIQRSVFEVVADYFCQGIETYEGKWHHEKQKIDDNSYSIGDVIKISLEGKYGEVGGKKIKSADILITDSKTGEILGIVEVDGPVHFLDIQEKDGSVKKIATGKTITRNNLIGSLLPERFVCATEDDFGLFISRLKEDKIARENFIDKRFLAIRDFINSKIKSSSEIVSGLKQVLYELEEKRQETKREVAAISRQNSAEEPIKKPQGPSKEEIIAGFVQLATEIATAELGAIEAALLDNLEIIYDLCQKEHISYQDLTSKGQKLLSPIDNLAKKYKASKDDYLQFIIGLLTIFGFEISKQYKKFLQKELEDVQKKQEYPKGFFVMFGLEERVKISGRESPEKSNLKELVKLNVATYSRNDDPNYDLYEERKIEAANIRYNEITRDDVRKALRRCVVFNMVGIIKIISAKDERFAIAELREDSGFVLDVLECTKNPEFVKSILLDNEYIQDQPINIRSSDPYLIEKLGGRLDLDILSYAALQALPENLQILIDALKSMEDSGQIDGYTQYEAIEAAIARRKWQALEIFFKNDFSLSFSIKREDKDCPIMEYVVVEAIKSSLKSAETRDESLTNVINYVLKHLVTRDFKESAKLLAEMLPLVEIGKELAFELMESAIDHRSWVSLAVLLQNGFKMDLSVKKDGKYSYILRLFIDEIKLLREEWLEAECGSKEIDECLVWTIHYVLKNIISKDNVEIINEMLFYAIEKLDDNYLEVIKQIVTHPLININGRSGTYKTKFDARQADRNFCYNILSYAASRTNNLKITKLLLEMRGLNKGELLSEGVKEGSVRGKYGIDVMFTVIMNDNKTKEEIFATLKLLLENDYPADVEYYDGDNLLLQIIANKVLDSSQKCDLIQIIFEKYPQYGKIFDKIHEIVKTDGKTFKTSPLLFAVDDSKVLEFLLQKGFNPDQNFEEKAIIDPKISPIIKAIASGNFLSTLILLKYNAEISENGLRDNIKLVFLRLSKAGMGKECADPKCFAIEYRNEDFGNFKGEFYKFLDQEGFRKPDESFCSLFQCCDKKLHHRAIDKLLAFVRAVDKASSKGAPEASPHEPQGAASESDQKEQFAATGTS